MLVEKDNLWHGLLTAKYGNMDYNILANPSSKIASKCKHSLWWRDISALGSVFLPESKLV